MVDAREAENKNNISVVGISFGIVILFIARP